MHKSKEGLPIGPRAAGDNQVEQDWGGMFPEITTLSPKQEYSSMYKDLPGGMCQAPHWGYVFSGALKIKYADHEETIKAGEAFYLAPGHIPYVEENTQLVQFSPVEKFKQTMETMQQNAQPGKNM